MRAALFKGEPRADFPSPTPTTTTASTSLLRHSAPAFAERSPHYLFRTLISLIARSELRTTASPSSTKTILFLRTSIESRLNLFHTPQHHIRSAHLTHCTERTSNKTRDFNYQATATRVSPTTPSTVSPHCTPRTPNKSPKVNNLSELPSSLLLRVSKIPLHYPQHT
jgi:hypothetical protein